MFSGAADFSELLRPRYRRPLAIGMSLMLFQQITGQPSVLYYAGGNLGFAGPFSVGLANQHCRQHCVPCSRAPALLSSPAAVPVDHPVGTLGSRRSAAQGTRAGAALCSLRCSLWCHRSRM